MSPSQVKVTARPSDGARDHSVTMTQKGVLSHSGSRPVPAQPGLERLGRRSDPQSDILWLQTHHAVAPWNNPTESSESNLEDTASQVGKREPCHVLHFTRVSAVSGSSPQSGTPAPHMASGHLLLTKYAVGLQLSLLLGPLHAPALDPLHPVLGTHGKQQDQVGFEQVPGPLVYRVTGRGQVLEAPTYLGGYGVGSRAVPVPEKERGSELPVRRGSQGST